MRLQSKQRRLLLSSLNENESPFKPKKTEQIFKNTANLSLMGTTYDAKHMDNFLDSGFGGRHVQTTTHQRAVEKNSHKSKIQSFLNTSMQVRASASFMNMERDQQKQQHYVDLYDGPSPLQKREGVQTLRDRLKEKSLFEKQREQHLQEIPQSVLNIKQAQEALLAKEDGSIRCPQQRRQELQQVKANIEDYKRFKSAHKFVGQRERLLKGQWRHGVTGVEDADGPECSVFYEGSLRQKLEAQVNKDNINRQRQKKLIIETGTGNQIGAGVSLHKRSITQQMVPERVREISKDWKCKGRVEGSSGNTFQRIYEPASNVTREKQDGCMNKIKLERVLKLREEEQKGKTYNIISGAEESQAKWINGFSPQLQLVGQ